MKEKKVEKLLKNYRSYKYATKQYERHKAVPQAGVANYSGMPSGSGAPELFFAQVGRLADMGNLTNDDHKDYVKYKEAVEVIEGALDTLTDDERHVMELKWMKKMSINQIADKINASESTVQRLNRSALTSLDICFRFIDPPVPHIEELPTKGSQHMRFNNRLTNHHMDLT